MSARFAALHLLILLIISGLLAKPILIIAPQVNRGLKRIGSIKPEKGVFTMTLFHTVSEKEATGKVKRVYKDIMATKKIDFVPNFWKALAINPDHLEATWQKLKAVMKPGKLDLRTKEIIALAVSITNNCEY
jgi:hypothetical protein